MKLRRVAVLGGGPGGLYAARLLKLLDPALVIDVYERGDADSTFGFGVSLAAAAQRSLEAADRATFDDIVRAAYPHEMSMRVGAHVAPLVSKSLRAIGRAALLRILQRHALEVGVALHYGARVAAIDLDADLVVAADGASSATRQSFAGDLGAHVEAGQSLYLWCGTELAIERAMFSPATTEHGTFVAHAYPYSSSHSTFLIETDEATWRRAGFDLSSDATPADSSDEASLGYLSLAFREQLEGHRLLGNRTRWSRFRSIHCERWHHRNIALLGDAAHTAHYSIGSGTKLAMEDAIALREAIAAAHDLDAALVAYHDARREPVAQLQAIARRSQAWWDAFPARMDLQIDRLMVAYMTRAGRVPLERVAVTNPRLVRNALASYGGTEPLADDLDVVAWPLARPFRWRDHRLPSRVVGDTSLATCRIELADGAPFGPVGDAAVARAADHGCVWITGKYSDRERLLDRLDVCERVKQASGAVVIVEAPAASRSDIAAALVSNRIDLVHFTP